VHISTSYQDFLYGSFTTIIQQQIKVVYDAIGNLKVISRIAQNQLKIDAVK